MSDQPVIPRLTRSERAKPKAGIVHLGPGAFFRAFKGIYTHEAVRASGGDWGIRAVSLRSPDIRDKLVPQGHAYTSVALTPEGTECEVIEIIEDVLVAPENPGAVLAAMTDANIRIVSLTITEKGYCHNPASGELRLEHPEIQHDLSHPESPRSALGFLVYALALRRAASVPAFTVLSCDNLPDNGALTRRVVLAFARALDPELAVWIESEARFPGTMVDRITPATTDADIKDLEDAAGYTDLACVNHEAFRQWVIEDSFVDDKRPEWNLSGARFVSDVAAFEKMKLRCLNGTHSTLAYLGYLAGYETIAETVADSAFGQLIDKLWTQEILPTVPQPEGEDLEVYCSALKERYLNPAIRHRTWQIAMDGSQKLPQRLLGTLAENLAAGRDITLLSLAIAGWMRYVSGIDEKGQPIDVRDPLVEKLRNASDSGSNSAQKVDALLALEEIFDADLIGYPAFRDALVAAYDSLIRNGARATVERTV